MMQSVSFIVKRLSGRCLAFLHAFNLGSVAAAGA